jgi:glycosyltransferase involved in cell wall biosynthesis
MHVFMTADAVGGVWTYSVDLARGLSAHGVRTTLAILGPGPTQAQRIEAAGVDGLDLVETGLELDWRADGVQDVAMAARRVSELAQDCAPDVVHLNSPSLAALAPFGPKVVGACHSCVATWWAATQAGDLPDHLRWQREMLARGYAACDVLVAPSAAFARATAHQYGYHPLVVHNGRAAYRMDAGERERCVLTAGRLWDCAKNLATLDAAAWMLGAPVYAAGALQMLPGEAMPVAHVTKLGSLAPEALRSRMARAAVFASLAVYEPFGLSVLEAAQCGCALVLSDIETFRELWEGAAIFVPPMDAQRCADVLRILLKDPAAADSLSESALARAQNYSLARMAGQMLDVYCGLLGQAGAAA